MSIVDVEQGNLLDADAEALVNTVNCVGVMGKGIALQFKQAFPENFRQYERACRNGQVTIGQMFIVPTDGTSGPKHIVNFPTKRHWKGKSRLEDIQSGLEALIEEVKRLNIKSIAVPPLGCGNGGLEWDEVKPRIKAAFAQVPAVRVLLFAPSGAPEPSAMPVATQKPGMTRARAILLQLLNRYGIPGYDLTLLEIQKLAYFLQLAGEPMKLQYVKTKYGPYAENLNHVLQRLEGHYIRGYGDRSRQASIAILPEAIIAASEFLNSAPDAQERLERVGRLIEGFETPYGMELLATVHWIAQQDSERAISPEDATIAVHAWDERKRQLFKPAHIRKAWQRLSGQGWLNAA